MKLKISERLFLCAVILFAPHLSLETVTVMGFICFVGALGAMVAELKEWY